MNKLKALKMKRSLRRPWRSLVAAEVFHDLQVLLLVDAEVVAVLLLASAHGAATFRSP